MNECKHGMDTRLPCGDCQKEYDYERMGVMNWKPTDTQIESAAMEEGIATKLSRNGNLVDIYGQFVPAYAHDHNAVQRLVQGLDDYESRQYVSHLRRAVFVNDMVSVHDLITVAKATAAQKFRALCAVKGWE